MYSFSTEERAGAISERIKKLSRDPLFKPDSITAQDDGNATDIVAGDRVIMTVTEMDARAEGRPRQELAQHYASEIKKGIEYGRNVHSPKAILLGIVFVLVVTAVLIPILVVIKRLSSKMYAKLDSLKSTRIRPIKFQNLEIFSAGRVAHLLIQFAKFIRLAVTLVVLYFYLLILLSFFPWTRGFAASVLDYILSPLTSLGKAFVSYLPKLFFVVIIVLVTRYLVRLTKSVFGAVTKGQISIPGFYAEWAEPTYKIVAFLMVAFAAVVAFPYLPGSQSPAFRGVSIFLGVLLSLGSTSAVANIVAGVILTYTRAFHVGDRVRIADTVGDVMEKTLLATRVRTIKNVDITIPNSMVLGSHIINYSSSAKEPGLILHTTVTIGYDAPWRKIHALLIAAADATEHILPTPAPFILQTGLDDFFVRYELNAYTARPHFMAGIYSELHQNIQDKFNEAGMEIMSPHYSALRDGNTTAIPASYVPPGREAHGFRIFNMQRSPDAADERDTVRNAQGGVPEKQQ